MDFEVCTAQGVRQRHSRVCFGDGGLEPMSVVAPHSVAGMLTSISYGLDCSPSLSPSLSAS